MQRSLGIGTSAAILLTVLLIGVSTPKIVCAGSAASNAAPSGARIARAGVTVPLHRHPALRCEVHGLDEAADAWVDEPGLELASNPPPIIDALGADAILNNRALSGCTCSGRGLNQVEPAIGAWGRYVLASWSDRRATSCGSPTSPSQSHGWSMDYGATFHEGTLLRGPGATDVFNGSAGIAVNKKTGDFYISGFLRQGTSSNMGMVAVRGQFGPDSFTIDLRKVIVPQATSDFVDRGRMAVDSASGTVYVAWSHYNGADLSTNIRIKRFNRDLDSLGPAQQITNFPASSYYPYAPVPLVGPEGKIYVVFLNMHQDTARYGNTPSPLLVVRSDDGGLTFGPPRQIVNLIANLNTVPPGSQRSLYFQLFSAGIDQSNGPHRGRLYAVWGEGQPNTPPVTRDTVVNEVENNDFFARAVAFTPGMKLRGEISETENDVWKFVGERGQIFYAETDSGNVFARVRMLCDKDTTSIARFRLFYGKNPGTSGLGLIYTGLPYDGTYYLHFESPSGSIQGYRIKTGLVPLAGERTRDFRDVFLTYSDDGETWSTPVRLNDDGPYYDNAHPQVAVDGSGRVHAAWLDWRDPECGTSSSSYGVSSGDGGVTWGPNRQLSDAWSFWGHLASCNTINQGDFIGMTADGDRVYSAFPDTRHGDPDVFVDASAYRFMGVCPPDSLVAPNHDAGLTFRFGNHGNFATPIAWQVSNSAGWTMFVSPSASGQTSIPMGQTASVFVNVHAPAGCTQDSTLVRLVTSDPAIPGFADTCITVVRCDNTVPVLVSLVDQEIAVGTVKLLWHVEDAAGASATVLRNDGGAEWSAVGTPTIDGAGRIEFEDRDVSPGVHGYRLVIELADGERYESETWVEVPGAELALEPVHPNPVSRGTWTLDFSLPRSATAAIDVFDMAGRRVVTHALGRMSLGRHRTAIETSALRDGIYLVVLRQEGRSISRKAVLAR